MSGKHWVTDPDTPIDVKYETSGFGAIPGRTVVKQFLETVEKHGNRKALCVKSPSKKVNTI